MQLYVNDVKSSVKRPEKELKAFYKVNLGKGETKVITLQLDKSAFSFYSELEKAWVLEEGEFVIAVGSSSRDIRLTEKVTW